MTSFLFAEIAKVSAVVGDARVVRDGDVIKIGLGTSLEKEDVIETKSNSKIQIIFKDNTVVTLGRNSALNINDYVYDTKNPKNSQTNLNFFKGAFKTITGNIGKLNKEKFKLKTKSSTIGIRGTVIIANQNMIACTQGAITVTSSGQSVQVEANQITFVKENEPPSQAVTISEENLNVLSNAIEPKKEEKPSSSDTSPDESSSENSEESSSSNSSENEQSSFSENSGEDNNSDSSSNDSAISSNSESSVASSNIAQSTEVAQEASNDNTNTTRPEVTEYMQKGFFLGSNKTAVASESFIQKDNLFEAKRVDGIYSYDESLTRTKEGAVNSEAIDVFGTKDFESFDEVGVGNYNGFPSS